MPTGLDVLSVTRIAGMMQGLVDVRTVPQELKYLTRTATTPASDNDVMALYRGYTVIADIIAVGQKALVYESGKIALEGLTIPKIKHGRKLSEQEMIDIHNLSTRPSDGFEMTMWNNWAMSNLSDLLLGVRQRMETMIVAMNIDAFTYDRLGIKIVGATWGMPTDLKFTSNPGWVDPTNSKPITDMLYSAQYARIRYGEAWNRATMSFSAFLLMVHSTEFSEKARFVLPPGEPTSIIPLQETGYLKNLATSLIGMQIEFYDARYYQSDQAGNITMAPFQPANLVVFSYTGDDNNSTVMDFANAVTTESLLGSMLPPDSLGLIGSFTTPTFGPIGYGSAEHNPPEVYLWGSARGWPRKKRKSCTGVLNVGTVEEAFPIDEPAFP